MKGIMANDTCYSTTRGWDGTASGNPFNTDGVERDVLDIDLARSALDFDIVKRRSYDEAGRVIPKQYHLVRSDDNSFIPANASVGEQFTPIQHRDVFDYIVHDIMPEVPEMKLELCGTIHGGGTGLIAASYGDTFKVNGDDSANEIRLFFSNPSNGTSRMVIGFTTVRIRCENTLMAATMEANGNGMKVSHTKSAPEATKRFIEKIRKEAVAALEMKAMSQELGRIGVDSETFERCLDAIYPTFSLPEDSIAYARVKKLRDEVTAEFESGDTARSMSQKTMWTAFNAFTYPVFNPRKLRKETDRAQIAYKGMTGDTGRKVLGMFQKVYSIARTVA